MTLPITSNQCNYHLSTDIPVVAIPVQHRTRLAAVIGLRFSKALAQFLPGGLRGLSIGGRARVPTKARDGMYLIRTGCPRSNICELNFTRALSSYDVRSAGLGPCPPSRVAMAAMVERSIRHSAVVC